VPARVVVWPRGWRLGAGGGKWERVGGQGETTGWAVGGAVFLGRLEGVVEGEG